MEGYLQKMKSDSAYRVFSNFTKRWFRLDLATKVFSYSSDPSLKTKKVFNAVDITSVEGRTGILYKPKGYYYDFKIFTRDRNFCLFAKSQSDRDRWLRGFELLIGRQKRKNRSLCPHPNILALPERSRAPSAHCTPQMREKL